MEPYSIGERIGSFLVNRFRNDGSSSSSTIGATASSTSPAAAVALGTSTRSSRSGLHSSSLDTFSADETDSEGGHF
eukprot:12914932-Ditylum_brightwellii.AAC.1